MELMEEAAVQVGELEPDMVILCTRAEDFDPADNILWELDINKSAVRHDVRCDECKHPVALSNHTYGRYVALDKKPRVCCSRCVNSLLST